MTNTWQPDDLHRTPICDRCSRRGAASQTRLHDVQVMNRPGFRPIVPVPVVAQTAMLASFTDRVPRLTSCKCRSILQSFDKQQAILTFEIVTDRDPSAVPPQVIPKSLSVSEWISTSFPPAIHLSCGIQLLYCTEYASSCPPPPTHRPVHRAVQGHTFELS